MAIDVTSVRTLLAVNGIGPDSSEEEITKLLAAAKYTPEEVTTALALLKQPAAPRPAEIDLSSVAPASSPSAVPTSMRASDYTPIPAVVTEERTLGPVGRWTGIAVALVLIAALALFAQKVLSSVLFVYEGWKASPEILFSFLPYVGGAFLGALVLLLVAWPLARLLYGTRSYALWLSLLVGTYVILWFLLLHLLLPFVLQFANIPDWMSFAVGMMLGVVMSFVNASLLICIVLAALFSMRLWDKGGKGKGIFAPVVVGLVAASMLIYVSGALAYPAKWLQREELCWGVAGKTSRMVCVIEADPANQGLLPAIPVAPQP